MQATASPLRLALRFVQKHRDQSGRASKGSASPRCLHSRRIHSFSATKIRPQENTRIPHRWIPSNDDIVTDSLEATVEKHREAAERYGNTYAGGETHSLESLSSGESRDFRITKVVSPSKSGRSTKLVEGTRKNVTNWRSQTAGAKQTLAALPKRRHVDPGRFDQGRQATGIRGNWARNYDVGSPDPDMMPWRTHSNPWKMESLTRLQWELESFGKETRVDEDEQRGIKLARSDIEKVFNSRLPRYGHAVHGSHATGLASALSDLDYCIFSPDLELATKQRGPSPTHPTLREAGKKTLYNLGDVLSKDPRFENVKMIRAKVDVLSCIHVLSNMTIQVAINHPVVPTLEYSQNYLAEYPYLGTLCRVLKYMLMTRGLDQSFTGGLSTYPLLIMIVASIKHSPPLPLVNRLAHSFLQFLSFWYKSDIKETGFSADPPRTFPKFDRTYTFPDTFDTPGDEAYRAGIQALIEHNHKLKSAQYTQKQGRSIWRPHLLCLQDPADPFNDLGIKAKQIRRVMQLFGDVQHSVEKNMHRWDTHGQHVRLKESLLWHSHGANYSRLYEAKQKLSQAGSQTATQLNALDAEASLEDVEGSLDVEVRPKWKSAEPAAVKVDGLG